MIYVIIILGIIKMIIEKKSMRIIYKKISELEESVLKEIKGYKILIIGIMIMILISNIIGLIPYSYTITSHFIITIGWSMMIIIGLTIIGIKKHGLKIMGLYVRKGTRKLLIRLLTWIEIISYMARGISLGIRLGANMLAGHCLLKIVMTFGYELLKGIWIIIPIIIISVLLLLEIGIGLLQAYVFTILVCYYIKDVIELH